MKMTIKEKMMPATKGKFSGTAEEKMTNEHLEKALHDASFLYHDIIAAHSKACNGNLLLAVLLEDAITKTIQLQHDIARLNAIVNKEA